MSQVRFELTTFGLLNMRPTRYRCAIETIDYYLKIDITVTLKPKLQAMASSTLSISVIPTSIKFY